MNRLAGIIVAAIGLLIAVLSILKVVPMFSLTMPGVMMIIVGGIIIGLSFVDKPDTEDTERMSTPNTLLNIFLSPAEVFQNLRRHPRWLVAVLVMTVLTSVYTNLFLERLTPERVTNYTIDKTLEMPMIQNNEQARKQVEDGRKDALEEAKNPISRVGQGISGFTMSVIGFAILGLIFFLFALAMGGKMNFWQAFSVAVYAYFPYAVIKFILNTIVLFIKDPTDIHPITGQGSLIQDNLNFLVTPKDNPVIYVVLGAFSILSLYWVWLNATGIKNGGERTTGTTGWSASLTVFFVLVVLAAVGVWAFPSFIS